MFKNQGKWGSKERLWFLIVLLVLLIITISIVGTVNKEIPEKDPLVEKIEQAGGKPVIVQTVKYGDDVTPKYARTYCQLLSFKRHIGDDQINCWVELIGE